MLRMTRTLTDKLLGFKAEITVFGYDWKPQQSGTVIFKRGKELHDWFWLSEYEGAIELSQHVKAEPSGTNLKIVMDLANKYGVNISREISMRYKEYNESEEKTNDIQ